MGRGTEGWMDRQSEGWSEGGRGEKIALDKQIGKWISEYTGKQMAGWVDRQMDRWRDG